MPDQSASENQGPEDGAEPEARGGAVDGDGGERFLFPARVRRLENTDELMELARAAAADPSVFEEAPPYFFTAQISNSNRDAYFTKMHQSTLRNFAAEASEGRALQENHNTRERPMGYSLRGKFTAAGGNGIARVEADFYTLPEAGGVAGRKVQLIHDIRAGIQRDVSVGFYLLEDGEYRCTICGRDMWKDWDCFHWPGQFYEEEGKEPQLAEAVIHNGHLAETSPVYDGATPDAMITKAQREMESGRMKPETARLLETQYRIKLPGARHVWNVTRVGDGGTLTGALTDAGSITATSVQATLHESSQPPTEETQGETMTDEERAAQTAQDPAAPAAGTDAGGALAADAGSTATVTPPEATRFTATGTPSNGAAPNFTATPEAPAPEPEPEPVTVRMPAEWTSEEYQEHVRAVIAGDERPHDAVREITLRLVREVNSLRTEAEDGRAYRESLLTDLCKQGVAAFGNTFDERTTRAQFAGAPLDFVRSMTAQWKQVADALFPSGRRSSDTFEPEPEAGNGTAPRVPDRLYAG